MIRTSYFSFFLIVLALFCLQNFNAKAEHFPPTMYPTDLQSEKISNEELFSIFHHVSIPHSINFSQVDYKKMSLNFHVVDELDFSLSEEYWKNLLKGDVYYSHSVKWDSERKSEAGQELVALFKKIGMENFIHNEDIKDPMYSVIKTVYVLPKMKGSFFSKEVSSSKEYIRLTNVGLKNISVYEKDDKLYVLTEKKISLFKDAVVEMSFSEPALRNTRGKTEKRYSSCSDLTSTDKNNKYIKAIRSVTLYQDLPENTGVLVTNYGLAVADGSLKMGLSTAITIARKLGQDKKGFEKETGYSIRQILDYAQNHSN